MSVRRCRRSNPRAAATRPGGAQSKAELQPSICNLAIAGALLVAPGRHVLMADERGAHLDVPSVSFGRACLVVCPAWVMSGSREEEPMSEFHNYIVMTDCPVEK